MHERPRRALALLALAALAAAPLGAQAPTTPPAPFATVRPHALEVAAVAGAGRALARVDERVVVVPGAPSLRLYFDEVELGGAGFLDVTSVRDGERHRLTPDELAKWDSSSAFFNGDTLLLELWLAPGERGGYRTSHLLVGRDGVASRSFCGSDDRVPSTDNRACRWLNSAGTAACSGWLGPYGCGFTAGHCSPTYANVAEFNVPPSTTGGALQHPPVNDQFPIDVTSIRSSWTVLGDDWTVATVQPNASGEVAWLKYGAFNLGYYTPSAGETVRVTGYGNATATLNQTQQTEDGPYVGAGGTSLQYTLDTTSGSSGSPVIHEASQDALGIHTNGGCASAGYNSGSGNLNPGFQAAVNALCVPPSPPLAGFTASSTTVVAGATVYFTDTSGGSPSSWSWDLDGDGLADATSRDASFVYVTPGTYDVTLTVTNVLGSDALTIPGLVTVVPLVPARLPYSQDFGAGLPTGGEWELHSENAFGAIAATGVGAPSPVSGDPALTLAGNAVARTVTNEARLHVDLSGATGGRLYFWYKETGDEDDPEDGLFLSDGTSEVQAVSFNGGPSVWTQYFVDLGAAAAAGGLALTADFELIFRQRDDQPLGTDGILIDDVLVTPDQTLTGTPATLSLAAGGTQFLTLSATPATAGLVYLVLGSAAGTTPGLPAFGKTLPLNWDGYLWTTLSAPNTTVAGSLGVLNAVGFASASLSLATGADPALAGATVHHAYVVLSPSAPGGVLAVSNAAPLSLVP